MPPRPNAGKRVSGPTFATVRPASTTRLAGGMVIDGSGRVPAYRADLWLNGPVIERVIQGPGLAQSQAGAPADRVLDCSGAYVAPGFIDIHSHSDLTWLRYPECSSRVTQGITTDVVGNCGLSPAPRDPADPDFRKTISVIDEDPASPFAWESFEEFLDVLGQHEAATNVAPMVGHGSIRQMALSRTGGNPGTASGHREVAEITRTASECLQSGAWGVSLGLMYAPGEAASLYELTAVARECQSHGALVAVHMRDYEAAGIGQAIVEMVRVHDQTGVNLELSHLRVLRADDLETAARCLELLGSAGEGVTADAYPYTAGQTTLFQLLAPKDRSRGISAMLRQLPEHRAYYAASAQAGNFSPADVVVVRVEAADDASAIGKSLARLADEYDRHWSELAVDLLQRSNGYVDVIAFGSQMSEQEMILAHPKVMIGSDGWALPYAHSAAVHPRAFGAFPKALRLLVDAGTSWEVAVAKATSIPAAKIGLTGRGLLKPGAIADVTVFEPENLQDMATYTAPFTPARGIRHVLVAGRPVMEDGVPTAARPGRALQR